ncbi:Chromate resistance protein ChrB [Streptomyces sp. NPDC005727]|uniref:Chromate resistance protein ChrB n=1 Tax=Streptomyces sp. NPDC005727 TaxID=3157053 RepID=UPI0033F4B628
MGHATAHHSEGTYSGVGGVAPHRRCSRLRGALYLQQSVCLLPDRPAVATALTELHERVCTDGGRMRILHVEITDEGERGELAEEVIAAIDEEYAEVLERLPSFFAELEMEGRSPAGPWRAMSRTRWRC